MALAFLDPEIIDFEYGKILAKIEFIYINNEECPFSENVRKFTNYVEKTWIGKNAMYPKSLWSNYKKKKIELSMWQKVLIGASKNILIQRLQIFTNL